MRLRFTAVVILTVFAVAAMAVWRPAVAWWFDDLGGLALARGDAANARALYEKGLALAPNSALLLEDEGRALLDADPASALAYFHRAACGAPCVAEMGDARTRLGHADAAVADYLVARAAGRLAAAVDRIAAQGKYDDAIALETALTRRLGDSILLRADLAAAYAKIGRLALAAGDATPARAASYHRSAIAALERASALAPYNEGYLLSLGFAQLTWGDKAAARAVFEHLLKLHPHQADAERALERLTESSALPTR